MADAKLLNTLLDLPFLFRPLLHAQNYLWCRANPTMSMSLFGLMTIPTSRESTSPLAPAESVYPPALVVLDLLTGGPDKALGGIIGLIAGHAWYVRRMTALMRVVHRVIPPYQSSRTLAPSQSAFHSLAVPEPLFDTQHQD
jgi:hypothetical protein